jgi:hypothetical protein
MKRAFSNLKKAVPPKARIAILAVFFCIGIMAYLIISLLFSGRGDNFPSDNGLFTVETKINKTTELSQNNLLSEDNSINTELNDLRAEDIESIKNSDDSTSLFPGVRLDKKKDTMDNNDDNNDDKDSRNNSSVVDLSSMFSGTEFNERKKASEEKSKKDISDLETKLGIRDLNSSTLKFNKEGFLSKIESSLSQGKGASIKWDSINNPSSIKFSSYSTTQESKGNASSLASSNSSYSTISKENVDKKRKQYLAKYDEMKTDLESRLSGNTQVVEDAQGSTAGIESKGDTPVISQGEEYESNVRFGAGEIMYAINDIEIVSDESNVVRVTIAQNGDTYGAILLGSFSQIGDVIGLKFSSYTVDNKSYPINAIAIDSTTWKSGLADEVDQHYFSTYFGIIAAALVEGYAETLSDSSTTVTDSGTTDTSSSIESTSERLQAAVGKVGEYLAPEFLKNIGQSSTVTVYRNKGLGIMLMEDFRVPARN